MFVIYSFIVLWSFSFFLDVNRPLWENGSVTYFFELFTDHCEGFEDGVGGSGHGDDSLRTRRVRDIDFGTALKMKNNRLSRNIRKYYGSAKMYGMMSSCCANIGRVNKFVVHYRVLKMSLHMAKVKARFFHVSLIIDDDLHSPLLVEFLLLFFFGYIFQAFLLQTSEQLNWSPPDF